MYKIYTQFIRATPTKFYFILLYLGALETLSSTLSFVEDKLRIYSYVTLMIIIQSVYLYPKEIRLCV